VLLLGGKEQTEEMFTENNKDLCGPLGCGRYKIDNTKSIDGEGDATRAAAFRLGVVLEKEGIADELFGVVDL